jgi:hypothetical protein
MASINSTENLSWDACLPKTETSSGPFVARCYSSNDRTGHGVWWVDGEPHLILASLEGTPDQAWPTSPPLQEIVAETVAAGRQPSLLGVGMAGKSHWSATIEGDGFSEAIAFDIACRTAEAPALLGSAYLLAPHWKAERIADNSLLLVHENGYQAIIDTIGPCALAWAGANIAMKPLLDATTHQRGKTYRWRYVLKKA